MKSIKFSYSPPHGDKLHSIDEEDVKIVLQRLPEKLYERLIAIHFNDLGHEWKWLGYVDPAKREIGICAIPPRISLTMYLSRTKSPLIFGAVRGCQWPRLAVRRYMLYDVVLHEIGHLQLIDEKRKSKRLRYAKEKLAKEFAEEWRQKLWSQYFDHPDPVHNPPSREEVSAIKKYWSKSHAEYKKGLIYEKNGKEKPAAEHYLKAIEIYPDHSLALERIGILYYYGSGIKVNNQLAIKYLQRAMQLDPGLAEANLHLAAALNKSGEIDIADKYYNKAIKLYNNPETPLRFYANALNQRGNFREAEAQYRKALRKNKNDILNYMDYGKFLINSNNPNHEKNGEKAINIFKKAVEIDAKNAEAHYLLGHIFRKFNKHTKQTIYHLKTALKLRPGYQEVKLELKAIKNELTASK